jgi:hypothetical protein
MEKASGEVSPGHAKTDDDDEDDWEMTLNRYSCLATIGQSLRTKTIRPSKRLALSQRLWVETVLVRSWSSGCFGQFGQAVIQD